MRDFSSLGGDANRGPVLRIYFSLYAPGQPFKAHDENIGGNGIPLFDASRRVEEVISYAIDHHNYRNRGYAGKNEIGEVPRKAKEEKCILYEGPFYFVKGFL